MSFNMTPPSSGSAWDQASGGNKGHTAKGNRMREPLLDGDDGNDGGADAGSAAIIAKIAGVNADLSRLIACFRRDVTTLGTAVAKLGGTGDTASHRQQIHRRIDECGTSAKEITSQVIILINTNTHKEGCISILLWCSHKHALSTRCHII